MTAPLKGLKRYSRDYEGSVFEFQAVAYPERDVALIPARWRWMFVEAALVRGVEPLIWLYYRKGELVAHQGAIPVACKLGDAQHETGWFVETMVLEKVRGGPVGAALVTKALEDMPFNLSLGQSPLMRELQYRLGWKKVATLNTYVLPLAPDEILASRSALLRVLLQPLMNGWNLLNRLKRRFTSTAGLQASELTEFTDAHTKLWGRVAQRYVCSVCRDAKFLNWKFTDQPGQVFERYEVADAQMVRGIIVLRERATAEPYTHTRLEINEIVVAPDDRPAIFALLQIVVERADALGAPLVFLHIRHAQLERSLRQFGFIKREATRWLLLATNSLVPAERELAEEEANWLLTGSDSDIDRP